MSGFFFDNILFCLKQNPGNTRRGKGRGLRGICKARSRPEGRLSREGA